MHQRDGQSVDRVFVLATRGLVMCFIQMGLGKREVVRREVGCILGARRSDDPLGFANVHVVSYGAASDRHTNTGKANSKR